MNLHFIFCRCLDLHCSTFWLALKMWFSVVTDSLINMHDITKSIYQSQKYHIGSQNIAIYRQTEHWNCPRSEGNAQSRTLRDQMNVFIPCLARLQLQLRLRRCRLQLYVSNMKCLKVWRKSETNISLKCFQSHRDATPTVLKTIFKWGLFCFSDFNICKNTFNN